MASSRKTDRIFVKDGRRVYRRAFSRTEARLGIGILVVLVAIVGWVAWKGANPDPSLLALDTDLAQGGMVTANTVVADRGPVPADLAAAGWYEGELSQFDYDNLYVKINGREGYYKSFGFETLYFMSIVSEDDPTVAIDIELYDLGNPANAVGAYSGERSPDATPESSEAGLTHIERNALYMTQGRYYLRAIGSEETPEVRAQLERLQDRFAELPAEPLPWGFTLFVGRMGVDPGALAYSPENAFSFGFAKDVYTAEYRDNGRLFVTPAGNEATARELAEQYRDGFRQYGTDEGDFVKDRYLGNYSTAKAAGSWVVGVHRATDTDDAAGAIDELAGVVRGMPLPEGTTDAGTPATPEEEYEADEY